MLLYWDEGQQFSPWSVGMFSISGLGWSWHVIEQQRKLRQISRCVGGVEIRFVTHKWMRWLTIRRSFSSDVTKEEEVHPLTPMKIWFATVVELTALLRLSYVPSTEDPADKPFCHRSLSGYRLTETMWQNVQWEFGGSASHMFDWMALDSQLMKTWSGNSGKPLGFLCWILAYFLVLIGFFCAGHITAWRHLHAHEGIVGL